MVDLRDVFYSNHSEKAEKFRSSIRSKIRLVEQLNSRGFVDKFPVRLNTGIYVSVAGAENAGSMWVVPVFEGETVIAIIIPEVAAFVERFSDRRYRIVYDSVVEYYERYEPMKKFRRLNINEKGD